MVAMNRSGGIGVMFKIVLEDYNCMFVGKGATYWHTDQLTHEERMYERLSALQGYCIPVSLGYIELDTPRPIFPQGDIADLLLLSWAGVPLQDSPMSEKDLQREIDPSLGVIRAQGVIHNDERRANLLWNEEKHRVVVIDFNQAEVKPRRRQVKPRDGKAVYKYQQRG